jgi:hypothetical protein
MYIRVRYVRVMYIRDLPAVSSCYIYFWLLLQDDIEEREKTSVYRQLIDW